MSKTFTVSDATAAELAAVFAGATPSPAPSPSPQPAPGPAASFVMPAECAGRARMQTEMKWDRAAGSFYSPGPLTDANAWLIGFTVGDANNARLSTIEFGGDKVARNWQLIRNRDMAVVARSASGTQTPGVSIGASAPLAPRIKLDVGERYTFAIWNAQPGASSKMVAALGS